MTHHASHDDPLAIIEEEARAMARCFGVGVPEEAAACLIDRLLFRLGGAHIYLPRRSSRARRRTHEKLVERFNGSNLFELAQEFDISPRHVRRIIASSRSPRN